MTTRTSMETHGVAGAVARALTLRLRRRHVHLLLLHVPLPDRLRRELGRPEGHRRRHARRICGRGRSLPTSCSSGSSPCSTRSWRALRSRRSGRAGCRGTSSAARSSCSRPRSSQSWHGNGVRSPCRSGGSRTRSRRRCSPASPSPAGGSCSSRRFSSTTSSSSASSSPSRTRSDGRSSIPAFKERLFYRWVRHPLMLGLLDRVLGDADDESGASPLRDRDDRLRPRRHPDRGAHARAPARRAVPDYQRRVPMLLPFGPRRKG